MDQKILELTAHIKPVHMQKFSKEVSERYRKRIKPYLEKEGHYLSYLVTRFPATSAVIEKVLNQIQEHTIESFLDLGSGPGTALWVVRELFSHLKKATLVEESRQFVKIGKALTQETFAKWLLQDLKDETHFEPHDLVLFSYSIGEIEEKYWHAIFSRAWMSTKKILVVIEPGTPAGFQRIVQIRQLLQSLGAHILAPCCHKEACPIKGGDWCHFAARVSRSSEHRKAKEGSLGFEDEKFSYLIFSKNLEPLPNVRVLRHPFKGKGHVSFVNCHAEGLENITVSRKDGDLYTQYRKAKWGDSFNDREKVKNV